MLRGESNILQEVWYPDPRCFNDSAVDVLDRTMVEGNPRVLKTTLNPSPYVVLRPLFKSTLVMRIADRFTSLYNNDDLKLFQGNSPLFQNLPKEVLRYLGLHMIIFYIKMLAP
jgi:hypothetical protein